MDTPSPSAASFRSEDDEEEPSATTAIDRHDEHTTAPTASHAVFGIFGTLSIRSGPPAPLTGASRFLGLCAAGFGAAHLTGA